MGDLRKFRSSSSKSVCSIFIPKNCQWGELLDIVSLRLNLRKPINYFEIQTNSEIFHVDNIQKFYEYCQKSPDYLFVAHDDNDAERNTNRLTPERRANIHQNSNSLSSSSNMKQIPFRLDGQLREIQLRVDCTWQEMIQTIESAFRIHRKKVIHFMMHDEDGDQISSVIENSVKFWKFYSLHNDLRGYYFEIFTVENGDTETQQKESTNSIYPSSGENAGFLFQKPSKTMRVLQKANSPENRISRIDSLQGQDNNEISNFLSFCTDGNMMSAKKLYREYESECLLVTDSTGNTALHLACIHGHDYIVEWLIKVGADLLSCNQDGNTPLHCMCVKGSLQNLQICQKSCKKFSVDVKNNQNDNSLLHVAVHAGNMNIVEWILNISCKNLNSVNDKGHTPLHLASWKNHFEIGKLLIEHGACVNVKDLCGRTPLYLACAFSDLLFVKLLRESGASTDVPTNGGDTLLHAACQWNSSQVVQYLIDIGLNPEQPSYSGITPLELGNRSSREDVRLLFAAYRPRNLQNYQFFKACEVGNETEIAEFIQKGISINETVDKYQRNGLQISCIYGHLHLLSLFIESYSADVNITDSNGANLLHLSSLYGHIDIVKYLLQNTSLNISKTTFIGDTPLHYACQAGHMDIMVYFHELGFFMSSIKNFDEENLLHISAKYGHVKLAEYLISKNVSLVDKNKLSQTPLHLACYHDHTSLVLLLLQYLNSEEIDEMDYHGMTPFLIACQKGNLEVAQALFQHGADSFARSFHVHNCNSALHFASQSGCVELIEWLIVELQCDVVYKNTKHQTCYSLAKLADKLLAVKWFEEHQHLIPYHEDEDEDDVLPEQQDNSNQDLGNSIHIIHQASAGGNYMIVKKCLQDGVNSNLLTTTGMSPLHYACRAGHLEIIKQLVHHGANLHLQDSLGFTPFQYARNSHHEDIIKWLTDYERAKSQPKKPSFLFSCLPIGVPSSTVSHPQNSKPPSSQTLSNVKKSPATSTTMLVSDKVTEQRSQESQLCNFCFQGDLSEVKKLIEAGVNINCISAPGDRTPLHCACLSGKLELVSYLITKGAHPNPQNLGGLTPLHIACDRGYSDICLYLIHHGADVEIPNKNGNNSLHLLCLHDCTQLFQDIILLPRTVVKSLDIDMKNGEGYSYMHIATIRNNLQLVKFLSTYPSQINPRESKLHEIPLHLSCKNGNYDISECLLSSDTYINARNDNGICPLHYACNSGELRLVKLLVKKGANVHVECDQGYNPLHYACQSGTLHIIKYLIKLGLNPYNKNENNISPFQIIEKDKYPEVYEWLLAWSLATKVGKSVEEVLNEIHSHDTNSLRITEYDENINES